MKNQEIKEILILLQKDFCIEYEINLNFPETETIENSVGFEYKTNGLWHEVYMETTFTVIKDDQDDQYIINSVTLDSMRVHIDGEIKTDILELTDVPEIKF